MRIRCRSRTRGVAWQVIEGIEAEVVFTERFLNTIMIITKYEIEVD